MKKEMEKNIHKNKIIQRHIGLWLGSIQVAILLILVVQSHDFLYALLAFVVLCLSIASLYFFRGGIVDEKNTIDWQALAYRDELTGLLNRRGLLAKSMPTNYCLLLIDIDDFKIINDNHGHATGDAVLKHLAKMLLEKSRLSDRCARWGGDEFVVLLSRADKQSAHAFVSRLTAQLIENQSDLPPCTFSIGMADTTQSRDRDELVNLADEQLLLEKKSRL